jgi:hypothetical protein
MVEWASLLLVRSSPRVPVSNRILYAPDPEDL